MQEPGDKVAPPRLRLQEPCDAAYPYSSYTRAVSYVISTDPPVRSRLLLGWVVGSVICVFGPYIISGVRTEQMAMYGSAMGIVLTQWPRLLRILRPVAPLFILWGAYAAVACVATIFVRSELPWPPGSLLAGMDNALLPLATLITSAFWGFLARDRKLLRVVALTFVGAMSLNSVLALAAAYAGNENLPFMRRFWAADGPGLTVALLAEQMGRFSGVFNQPAEAGIAYSLAAFCLLYLVRTGSQVPSWLLVAMWVLIILGGLLTISKIFLVGGVFVAGLLLMTDRKHRAVMGLSATATVVVATLAAAVGWAGAWGISTMFSWYRVSVERGDSRLYTLSAGRFGKSGTDSSSSSAELPSGPLAIAQEVVDKHPWFGVGARGAQVAYDTMWIEALITAGLLGVMLVAAAHVTLVLQCMQRWRVMGRPEWLLFAAVVILILGSSLGIPSLTGNREGTLLWMFVGLLLTSRVPVDRPRSERALSE